MKRLDIIVPHEYLPDVNEILRRHKVGGMSFYDVKGRGRAKHEPVTVGRGVISYVPEFASRTKVEIVDDVLKAFGNGTLAIGKIFVCDIAEAYDIGTKVEGDSAL